MTEKVKLSEKKVDPLPKEQEYVEKIIALSKEYGMELRIGVFPIQQTDESSK